MDCLTKYNLVKKEYNDNKTIINELKLNSQITKRVEESIEIIEKTEDFNISDEIKTCEQCLKELNVY